MKLHYPLLIALFCSTILHALRVEFPQNKISLKQFLDQTDIELFQQQNNPAWKKFITNYVTTLFTGLSTGALIGSICAYIEHSSVHMGSRFNYLCTIPVSWLIFWNLRETLVKTLSDDLQETHIPHNKTRAQELAYISDWVAYFAMHLYYNQ